MLQRYELSTNRVCTHTLRGRYVSHVDLRVDQICTSSGENHKSRITLSIWRALPAVSRFPSTSRYTSFDRSLVTLYSKQQASIVYRGGYACLREKIPLVQHIFSRVDKFILFVLR